MPLEGEFESLPVLSLNDYRGKYWYSLKPNNTWAIRKGNITKLRVLDKPALQLTSVHKILAMGESPRILALKKYLRLAYPHLGIHHSRAC